MLRCSWRKESMIIRLILQECCHLPPDKLPGIAIDQTDTRTVTR